jgi:hypothetical protein
MTLTCALEGSTPQQWLSKVTTGGDWAFTDEANKGTDVADVFSADSGAVPWSCKVLPSPHQGAFLTASSGLGGVDAKKSQGPLGSHTQRVGHAQG